MLQNRNVLTLFKMGDEKPDLVVRDASCQDIYLYLVNNSETKLIFEGKIAPEYLVKNCYWAKLDESSKFKVNFELQFRLRIEFTGYDPVRKMVVLALANKLVSYIVHVSFIKQFRQTVHKYALCLSEICLLPGSLRRRFDIKSFNNEYLEKYQSNWVIKTTLPVLSNCNDKDTCATALIFASPKRGRDIDASPNLDDPKKLKVANDKILPSMLHFQMYLRLKWLKMYHPKTPQKIYHPLEKMWYLK